MTIRRWNPRQSFKGYVPWVALLLAPLVLNGVVWSVFVHPRQRQVARWQDAHTLAALKPKLDALLTQSHDALMEWDRTDFTSEDPSAVTQTIERLARLHRVQLGQVNAKPGEASEHAHAPKGMTASSLTVDVTGRFGKLAQWMSDLERQSGLQVESWTLAAGDKPGDPHKLTVNVTAFLRGA